MLHYSLEKYCKLVGTVAFFQYCWFQCNLDHILSLFAFYWLSPFSSCILFFSFLTSLSISLLLSSSFMPYCFSRLPLCLSVHPSAYLSICISFPFYQQPTISVCLPIYLSLPLSLSFFFFISFPSNYCFLSVTSLLPLSFSVSLLSPPLPLSLSPSPSGTAPTPAASPPRGSRP